MTSGAQEVAANTPDLVAPLNSEKAPEHLNSAGCYIKYIEGKGRGVFAARDIPAQTVVEISPVLLFGRDEYQEHGRYTVLDHYTFVWHDGRMALALGLGSLFNHSRSPNVSYTLDHDTESIRYTTARSITKDEELCIFYGHKLWFEDANATAETQDSNARSTAEDAVDPLCILSVMQDEEAPGHERLNVEWPLMTGDADEIIPETQLPFTRLKLIDDEEEDEIGSVQLEKAWAVDIPDPRHTTTLLRWLQQSGLDNPPLSHLKRIRRSKSALSTSTLLLTPFSSSPAPPELPLDLNLPQPYAVDVPQNAALTQKALKAKSTFWPTIYAPRKKFEPEPWTRGKVRWAYSALKRVVEEAELAKANGELPIAAHVPVPFDQETRDVTEVHEPFTAHDTRNSLQHPLRHAALNLVRRVADYRALPVPNADSATTSDIPPVPTSPIDISASFPADNAQASSVERTQDRDTPRNGLHYLLTGLTLFISHEPCIMCAMALLHSRVKEVFYLTPMEKTGGCGGVACVPKLPGVNHRYGITRWKLEEGYISTANIRIDPTIDA